MRILDQNLNIVWRFFFGLGVFKTDFQKNQFEKKIISKNNNSQHQLQDYPSRKDHTRGAKHRGRVRPIFESLNLCMEK